MYNLVGFLYTRLCRDLTNIFRIYLMLFGNFGNLLATCFCIFLVPRGSVKSGFPIPDQQSQKIDALNINWSGLIAYTYPPTALFHKVIKKICFYKQKDFHLGLRRVPSYPADILQLRGKGKIPTHSRKYCYTLLSRSFQTDGAT